MREPWALVTTSGRRPGEAVRLYGPDSAGTLDTSAALPNGGEEYFPAARALLGHCQGAHGVTPHGGWARYAGHVGAPHGAAHGNAAVRAHVPGKRVEYLRGQYAAQTIDMAGHDSGTPVNVGTVLVSSAPAVVQASVLSVAAGVVSMAITQQVE